ncbi:MAG: LruC domain-containing protein [Bacteroidales bacterium]
MKIKTIFLVLLIPLFFLSGCVSDIEGPERAEYFDFATVKEYKLDLNYSTQNDSKIFFEIYQENPININGQKNINLKPIAKGFTDKKGRANFDVFIPSGLKRFYVYTSDLGVPTLLEAVAENNVIRFYENNFQIKSLGTFGFTERDAFWDTSLGGWDFNGEPQALMTPDIVPSRLLTDIKGMMPSTVSLPATKPYLLADNASTKIIADATVFLTFLHEGAGHKNTMGYFVYPTNNPPTSKSQIDEILVFPNLSYKKETNGCLVSGDKVQLRYKNPITNVWSDIFPAGTSIGWVFVAMGYERPDVSSRGSVGADKSSNHQFYSISSLNPEPASADKRHCVVLYDEQTQFSVIGFEDWLTHQADNDYEDVLLYVSSSPAGAIEPPPNTVVPYVPILTTYSTNYSGSIAFEDLWPYKGDYDMNDVVVEYNINQVYNQDNKILSASGYYKLVHDGAKLNDGFGFQLGVSDSKVKSYTVNSTYTDPYSLIQRNAKGLEQGQNLATAILFSNAKNVFNSSATDRMFNFNILFNTPINSSKSMTPPYNPFIFTNSDLNNLSRVQEVHLPNYLPTAKADKSLFGTGHDKSNESLGLYYVSDQKFPFAIHIPTTYLVPSEMMRIDAFYPRFNDWVNSFGANNTDWYNFPIGTGK